MLIQKIRNVKSIEDFFYKLFWKIDYLLMFPKRGFTRMHTDNFMKIHFENKVTVGLKILDVGAGNKPYQNYFKDAVYESCDSKEALFDIHKNNDQKHTFYCDITKEIPRADNYYDIIICNEVFEHINEPQSAAIEIYRVLKKNGEFYMTVPQCHGLHMEPHNYFNYLSFGIEYILNKAGFKKIIVKPLGGIYHLLGKILYNSTLPFFSKLDYKKRLLFFVLELPLKIILLIIFVLLYYADNLDYKKKWTINYGARAEK